MRQRQQTRQDATYRSRKSVQTTGAGSKFDLAWKPQQLPTIYIASVMAAILLFELLPYVEEFLRGLRANAGKLVPMKARRAKPGQTTLR